MVIVTEVQVRNQVFGKYSVDLNGNVFKGKNQLKPYRSSKDYRKIAINKDSKRIQEYLHRIVWESFMGSIPEGYQIHHKNGNRKDNRLVNLQMVNIEQHRYLHSMNKRENKLIDEMFRNIMKKFSSVN